MITLSIVVPCFNEEAVLLDTQKQLSELLNDLVNKGTIAPDSSIYFVDDGSHDKTWNIIEECAELAPQIRGIKLTHNVGHQKALLAGLLSAEGDAIISIDADLQDDILAIPEMVEKFLAGNDIVYGVRKSRSADTIFKKKSAQCFYSLMNMLGVESVYNHADFRLKK